MEEAKKVKSESDRHQVKTRVNIQIFNQLRALQCSVKLYSPFDMCFLLPTAAINSRHSIQVV